MVSQTGKSGSWFVIAGLGAMLWLGVSCTSPVPPFGEAAESDTEGATSRESMVADGVKEMASTDASPQDTAGTEVLPQDAAEPSNTESTEPHIQEVQSESHSQDDRNQRDDGSQGEGGKKGQIQIYLKGDLTPETFQDGLVGQTPTQYSIALSRYWVLKSANDPAPQLCFDHGQNSVEADMSKDNLMGTCTTATIQDGSYTHGKVKVDWAKYSVTGTLHYNGLPLQGKFTFFRAYSNTTHDGKSYKAQEGWLEFQGPTTVRIPYTYPPLPAPSLSGVQLSEANGEFFMLFPFKRPLPIAQQNVDTHWARFHWKIFQAFRWADKTLPGYTQGTWDVAVDPTAAEEVKVGGVTGFFITTSLD